LARQDFRSASLAFPQAMETGLMNDEELERMKGIGDYLKKA